MKYLFGLAACLGVIYAFAQFGIEGGVVGLVAVITAMMVVSRFK